MGNSRPISSMITTAPDMSYCAIQGGPADWQVLWTNSLDGETLVGMTEKMKEQLCWCYCYLREFSPKTDQIIPLGLDLYERCNRDTFLIYLMIQRRLRPDIKTLDDERSEPVYYTWRLPFSVTVPVGGQLPLLVEIRKRNHKLQIRVT